MRKLCVLLVTALLAIAASAQGYNYLNFVKADATGTSFNTAGIKITFNGTTANVTSASGTSSIPMAGFSYLEFSDTPLDGTTPTRPKGDVNGDGVVDIADINVLINIILGLDTPDKYDGRALVNDDSVVDIADINAVINIILGLI